MPPIERHVRVHRTARFYQLGIAAQGVDELWVACHGYGQLASGFIVALAALASSQRIVIAPEALNRFYVDDVRGHHGPNAPVGATWMTREDRERDIQDYVEYLDLVTATVVRELPHTPRITALGFSQGVATAARWAPLGTTALSRLILWGGTLPPDLPNERGASLFKSASVTFVAGEKDQVVSLSAMEQARTSLSHRGIEAGLIVHDGGHALNSRALAQLAAQ